MKINRYYKDNSVHYYKKLVDGALHVMEGNSINNIPEYLIPIVEKVNKNTIPLEEITEEEFNTALRITIFELGLYEFFTPK